VTQPAREGGVSELPEAARSGCADPRWRFTVAAAALIAALSARS
jgi:hypothetical protein